MSKNNIKVFTQYLETFPFTGDIIHSNFKKLKNVSVSFGEFKSWFAKNRNSKEVRRVISDHSGKIKQNRRAALTKINKEVDARRLRLPKLRHFRSKGAYDEAED